MNRTEYRCARHLIRDNGRSAIRWLPPHVAAAMDLLCFGQGHDRLAERQVIVAWCRREGYACNVRQTA